MGPGPCEKDPSLTQRLPAAVQLFPAGTSAVNLATQGRFDARQPIGSGTLPP